MLCKIGASWIDNSLFCFIPESNHKRRWLKERNVPWFPVKDLFCRRWFRRAFSYSGDTEYNKYSVVSQLSLEYSFRNYLDAVSEIMKM